MADFWPPHQIVGAASLGLVLLLSQPAFHQIWTRVADARRHRGRSDFAVVTGAPDAGAYEVVPQVFESRDGVATEESVAAFTDRKPRFAASVSLVFGLAAALGAALLLTFRFQPNKELSAPWLSTVLCNWSDVAVWALLGLQYLSIPTTAQYDRRHNLSVAAFVSSVLLLVSLAYRHGFDIARGLTGADEIGIPENRRSFFTAAIGTSVCWLVQVLVALGAALSFASFPHRPDVYYKGGLVDQQNSASILDLFSFNWNKIVFDIANERSLELEDLPNLDGDTRSSAVTEGYFQNGGTVGQFYSRNDPNHKGAKGRLWLQLLMTYKWPLLLQWALTFVRSVLALFPQYVIYQFLEDLDHEKRLGDDNKARAGTNPRLWGWVIGIGVSIVLQIWVGSVQRWITSSRLETPMSALIQSLIFQKALRLDEASDPGHNVEDEDAKDKKGDKRDKSGKSDKSDKSDKKGKKAEGDVRQSVLNHMKLDSVRITIFCTYNYWFPLAIFKLVLAGSVLAKLLGWRAFLSGVSCAVIVYPISHVISKRYAKIQFGLMKYRDAKAHVLTEALQGMRQIKYSALEQLYERKILQSRNEELRQFWRVSKWMCALTLIINIGPILLSCVSLAVYTFTTATHVRASIIFASLGLFDQLDEAFSYLPLIQVYLMEAWTSCVRVEKYLNQPDKAPVAVAGPTVIFENVTVRWPRVEDSDLPSEGQAQEQSDAPTDVPVETRSILRDVNVEFPAGELSLITGKTGAGKSLLLATILGEVKLLSGVVRVPTPPPVSAINREDINEANWILSSLTAFVSQTPWVESGTLKNNILFGMPWREARYRKVIQACALDKDIELLADGDETEVGPKGVTLSGGQRWRVALARALYSRAGILVLDDVLSAVDAHVGRIIVNEALAGELARGRTRILATHHPEMCYAHAVYLVRLDNGHLENAEKLAESAAGSISSTGPLEAIAAASEENADENALTNDNKKDKDAEVKETGRVKTRVYREYIRASRSTLLWVAIVALLIFSRLLNVATTWSLKELSASYEGADGNQTQTQPLSMTGTTSAKHHSFYSSHNHDVDWHWTKGSQFTMGDASTGFATAAEDGEYRKKAIFWMTAYIVLDYSALFVAMGQNLLIMFTGLRASKVLFERMTHSILRAPLRWVDTVPTGRVLNRFTSDTYTVDRRLASDLSSFLQSAIQLIVIIAASISVSPFIVIFGVGLLFLYGKLASVYLAAAREAKRINSVAHSPVYDQFSSVLTGLSTIRAFHRTDFYMDRVYGLIDNSFKASWALQLLTRWMNFRMGMFGAVFVTAVAACIVFGNIEASLAGFGLVFALRYTSSLSRLLANSTSIELGFNAAERILEYIEIETESEGGNDAPAAWPTQGHIEVEDVTVSYAPELPPVLKNLNFEVRAGERIGVVGRTGAGKSTLAAVFFRLLEPTRGSIRIDGIDISTLKLDQLRSRLAIIPQDPFLFSGTLRSNLDLEDAIADHDLHEVLKRVHLVDPNAETNEEAAVGGDGGEGLSGGEELVEDHTEEDVARLLGSSSEAPLVAEETDAATPAAATPAAAQADAVVSDSATEVGETDAETSTNAQTTHANSPNTSDDDSESTSGPRSKKGKNKEDENSFTNLAMPVATGGGNLSQGQRQLVCLARAILTRPKIVVLDEATSAVDRGTDSAIQESLRREFAAGGCTVLVIAHRLSTVVDFDKLLVLKEGRVAEMGTPRELMERGMALEKEAEAGAGVDTAAADGAGAEDDEVDENFGQGAFWELVKKSAEKDRLLEMVFGEKV